MFTPEDLKLLNEKAIPLQKGLDQLESFKTGFPFLQLKDCASSDEGIMIIEDAEADNYRNVWDKYLHENKQILKFVPASGAASRMFKDLFAFLHSDKTTPETDFEIKFFDQINHFAFAKDLDAVCQQQENKSIAELLNAGEYKKIVDYLLNANGLNYGSLPKGVLKFHNYGEDSRTALEEHLVEGALYAANRAGEVNLHFTVSPEHLDMFESLVNQKKGIYEKKYGVHYQISFSVQKSSTDTLAVDANNEPFRDHGKLVFRPGGHGALIENLNEIEADVIFIKNIDNVVPDRLKDTTVKNKQLLGGVLITLQQRIFSYLDLLESGKYTHDQLMKILHFLETSLWTIHPQSKTFSDSVLVSYLIEKLNRPIRVCGMVKNEGEAGGGPFLTYNNDGTISLQILESSQIDMNNPESVALLNKAGYFNPVDLVCGVRDRNGNHYDLLKHVDPKTGFISHKSKDGRELKALELPGLWNGAMSDWNTVFVDVPIETFNPVKTVNDLLRTQHQ